MDEDEKMKQTNGCVIFFTLKNESKNQSTR